MSKEVTNGFPTHLEKDGELLRICLQKDHNLALLVESYLSKYLDNIMNVRNIPKQENLHPGLICIGQYDDQQYYRIKVLDHPIKNQTVKVLFIDYGNVDSLVLSNIRLLSYEHNTLLNIPPLAISCFLEGVNVLKQWNDEELSTLKKFILYEERPCTIRHLSKDISLVNIYIATNNKYLDKMIIENDLGTSISDTNLMLIAKGMMPSGLQYSDRSDQNKFRLLQQRAEEQRTYGQTLPQQMNCHTEKVQMPESSSSMQMLNVGSTYHVYVSHMEDGPYSFFVQLKANTEDALPRLTMLLKQHKPVPHTPPLMPGCMVMTHVLNDNSFRRSIVVNIRHDSCLVYHLDYGNSEDIPCSEIYQLPPQAKHAPAMALRFCLADIKSQQVTDSAKAYFQEFLERKCVLIRVVEEHSNPHYQYCEMFYDNKNVKEILWTFNSPLEYTSQLHPRGKDVKVTVSVVESPAQFYVQYTSKLDIINNIQEAVNAFCSTQPRLQDLTAINIGSPIAALFEDTTWYRGMVVGFNKDSTVKVLYVDYGNRSDVIPNNLCQISRELVTKWRTQAVECCLIGFENCGELNAEMKDKMVSRTLGLTYHLRLISILNSSRLLVDLIDNLGGKVSDDIKYSPPAKIQATPTFRDVPHHQMPKDALNLNSSAPPRNKNRIDTSIGTYKVSPKSAFQYFCDIAEHKGKSKNEAGFSRPNQRQNSFHSMESPYSEHDNRDVDKNNRGYNRQKSFDKGSRFRSDEGYKKVDNLDEDKGRKNRYSDERGGRSSVGSRGSDELDEKTRRGFGGPRPRPDEKAADQHSEERPRRGAGFNRQRDDERGSDQICDEKQRRPFNARSRTDDDKASDQFNEDRTRRGFRGPRQDDDRGRGSFGDRDRFSKREGDDINDRRGGRGGDDINDRRGGRGGDDMNDRRGGRGPDDTNDRRGGRGGGDDFNNRRGGRGGDSNYRRGGRGDDNERRGGRGFNEDSERRSGRGGNKWNGEGDSEDRSWKDGRRGGGGDWKRDDGGDRRSGPPRRGNWNKEDGESGGQGGDFRRKRSDSDFSSKRFPQDSSKDFHGKRTAVHASDEWGDTGSDLPKPPTTPTTAIMEYPMHNILANMVIKVHLSYMQNPHVFYVQPEGSEADLEEMRALIEADPVASLVPVKDVSLLPLGTPVLARYSLDLLLYRGLVQQVFPPSTVQVLFIDYGNCDSVQTNDIFLVTPKLALKAPIAIRCSLIDVSPVGTEWTADPDVYSKILEFDDAMTMNVISVKMLDGELLAQVRLTSPTGLEIAHLLSENGLAVNIGKPCLTPSEDKSAPSFTQNTEISELEVPVSDQVDTCIPRKIIETLPDKWIDRFDLLVGQRFYSTVLETVEENLFVICITEAKVIALVAAMIEQQHIPHLSPNTSLIIEVKAVQDNRLKALFFSIEGNQLNTKEGKNPQRVKPICPFPVVRRSDHVTVSYSEGAVVYLQRLCDAGRLAALLDDMYNFYEGSQPDPEARWKIGDICAAQSVLDSNWYRAILINGPKENTVRYLDYGSKEELSAENLRALDPQFIFSELCLGVFMSVYWRTPEPPLLDVVDGEELFAKFARDSNGTWLVDLKFADGEKVITKLVEKNIAREKNESPFDDENIIIGSDLVAGDSVSIVVSHDDSITKFWAHMMKHVSKIDELQEKLQNIIENLNDGKPDELKVFAAKYSEDDIWYRATKVGDNTLRFIDYGNTDSISDQVKELPPDLMRPTSGYAVPMYLCVKPINGEWPEKAIEIHQAFIENPSIIAEIINVDYKIVVDIKADGKLLSEALIEAGFAEYYDYIPEVIKKFRKEEIMAPSSQTVNGSANRSSLDTEKPDINNAAVINAATESADVPHPNIGESDRVFVVLCNSLNDFYIQEEQKTDTVDEIQNKLLIVELAKFTGTVEKGQLFAVQFEEDDLWYRAEVISTKPKVQVKFIDYGNIVTTSDLRILPEDVVSHPPLAINCSLDAIGTPELLSSFLKLTNFGQTPFHIKFKSYGIPHLVSLLSEDGRDVLDILLSHNAANIPAAVRKLPTEEELLEEPLDQNDEELLEKLSPQSQPSLQDKIVCQPDIKMELFNLELNEVKQGYISHINSVSDFYIQDIDVIHIIDQINNEFAEFEGLDEKTALKQLKTGDLVAAKYVDEFWYRGVVIEIEPEITVQFIDYGNECVVTEIYELPNGLRNIPPVAIKCSLQVDGELVPNYEDKFLEISRGGGTLFHFKILSKKGSINVVELTVDGRNVLLDLTDKKMESDIKQPANYPEEDPDLTSVKIVSPDCVSMDDTMSNELVKEATADLKVNGDAETKVDTSEDPGVPMTKVDTNKDSEMPKTEVGPNEVSGIPPTDIDIEVSGIPKTEVDKCKDSGESRTEFNTNEDCESPKSEVSTNEVSEILETNIDICKDSGQPVAEFCANENLSQLPETEVNTNEISEIPKTEVDANEASEIPKTEVDANEVSEIPKTEVDANEASEIPKTEVDANEVSEIPKTEVDANEVSEIPKTEIETSKISDTPTTKVDVYVNTGETMIKMDINEKPIKTREARFAFIRGVDDFYLHMNTAESHIVDKVLSETESFDSVEVVNIGEIVVVKVDGGKWLRGKILESCESSYKVLLIDNGQVITCNELNKISEDLSGIPPSAVHCSLQLPDGNDAWHPEAAAEFLRICNDLVIDEFEILDKSNNPYIVKIITNKGDLTCILKDFNSPAELVISQEQSNEKLSCVLKEPAENEKTEISDTIIAEESVKDSHNDSNVTEDDTVQEKYDIDQNVDKSQENLDLNQNGVSSVEDNKLKSGINPSPKALTSDDRDVSSSSNDSDTTNKKITNGSPAKKVINKPVKPLAEIKASAKPKVMTGLSKSPVKSSSNKSVKLSPVTKVKSEPQLDERRSCSPVSDPKEKRAPSRTHSLTMDERPLPGSLSQCPSPDLNSRPRQSQDDKIVPGSISGVNMVEADQD